MSARCSTSKSYCILTRNHTLSLRGNSRERTNREIDRVGVHASGTVIGNGDSNSLAIVGVRDLDLLATQGRSIARVAITRLINSGNESAIGVDLAACTGVPVLEEERGTDDESSNQNRSNNKIQHSYNPPELTWLLLEPLEGAGAGLAGVGLGGAGFEEGEGDGSGVLEGEGAGGGVVWVGSAGGVEIGAFGGSGPALTGTGLGLGLGVAAGVDDGVEEEGTADDSSQSPSSELSAGWLAGLHSGARFFSSVSVAYTSDELGLH